VGFRYKMSLIAMADAKRKATQSIEQETREFADLTVNR
jgi:hypothetical protein